MFRTSWCAAVAMAIAMTAYGDDKIGKGAAPAILKQVKEEIAKKQGFRCKQRIRFPSSNNSKEMNVAGVSKKDLAAFSGDADVYCNAARTLAADGSGKVCEPGKMTGADQVLPHCLQNPSQLLATVFGYGVAAKWVADETLDDDECKVAETTADANACENQLKQYFSVVAAPAGFENYDAMTVNNKNKSTSTYKIWIGKEDLLVHKIEWMLKMAVDQAKAGGSQFKMPEFIACQWVLEFYDYDTDLDIEVPAEIEKAFGIKK